MRWVSGGGKGNKSVKPGNIDDAHNPLFPTGERAIIDIDVMLDAVTDRGIVKLDPEGSVTQWSVGAQALLGYSEEQVLGQSASMFHTPADRADGMAERELVQAEQQDCVEFEGWRVREGGHQFRAAVTINSIRDDTGSVTGFVKVMRDLAADQRRAHPIFYELLEAAPDAMVIVAPDGRITMANAATDLLFGYPREELIGSQLEMLIPERFRRKHVDHRAGFFADPVRRRMGGSLELWALRRDGTEVPVDISLSPLPIEHTTYVSAAIRDITERHEYETRLRREHEELKKSQRELRRLARIDALTGLVNHAETIARLEAALQAKPVPGLDLGVLFCDVDHFKAINDTWGHPVGDVVLSTIGERMRDCVRDCDTVGRLGGDEMMVLLPDIHGIDEVVGVAEKIRRSVADPINHLGRTIYATVSIGATTAVPGESVSTMTARADAAMYKAKENGRNTVTAF